MASFRKRGDRWQVQVRRRGIARSESFDTKAAAAAWARRIEREIDEGRIRPEAPAGTLGDLVDRYETEIPRIKKVGRSTAFSLRLIRDRIGGIRLDRLSADQIIRFGQDRAGEGAGPATVIIDLSVLASVLKTARSLWRLPVDPEIVQEARQALAYVGLVARSQSRERRVTDAEVAAVMTELRRRSKLPLADAVEFALATGMRREEICRIRWADLEPEARIMLVRDRKHPREKKGNDQRVPLLVVRGRDPLEIIARQPRAGEVIFPIKPATFTTVFVRAVQACGIEDLRLHDLRHEATSRLFELGLSIERVALVTGHRDWAMLRRYTHLTPDDVVRDVTAWTSAPAPSSTPRSPGRGTGRRSRP